MEQSTFTKVLWKLKYTLLELQPSVLRIGRLKSNSTITALIYTSFSVNENG